MQTDGTQALTREYLDAILMIIAFPSDRLIGLLGTLNSTTGTDVLSPHGRIGLPSLHGKV